jgi:hypothetical protein
MMDPAVKLAAPRTTSGQVNVEGDPRILPDCWDLDASSLEKNRIPSLLKTESGFDLLGIRFGKAFSKEARAKNIQYLQT